MNKRYIASVCALITLLAGIFGGVAYYEYRLNKEREAELAKQATEHTIWTDENTIYLDDKVFGFDHRMETFLFIGTDNSGNEDGEGEDYHGAMADFLLLMVMDHTDKTYGYIQIDRNTVTEINAIPADGIVHGIQDQQICTAHYYGKDRTQSAENTVDAVKYLLGELDHIDGYYVLNMADIGLLNGEIGGVEVKIEDDMTNVDPAFVKGTTITLTDDQAEAFVRARMSVGEGDNASRMRRQKTYMNSFFKKAKEKTLENPKFAGQLWNALKEVAVTDMKGNDFSRIAEMFLNGETKGIQQFDGTHAMGTALDDGRSTRNSTPRWNRSSK